MLVTSIFSLSHNVFISPSYLGSLKVGIVSEELRTNVAPEEISLFPHTFFFRKLKFQLSTRKIVFTLYQTTKPAWVGQWLACRTHDLTCEFDPRLRRLFFPAYFCLSPLQKHERKVVSGIGKKSCLTTGVRKPGNAYGHRLP